MLSKTIIHILLRYLCIIFAFLIYTSMLTIYMYINSIRWDLWPDGTFILLMIIFAVVWIIMTGLYYLMFHFIWNKKHLPYYIVSIETFIAIIIFHFSEEFISDYLLRLSNQYVDIRLALGGERDFDFDWVRFEVPEPGVLSLFALGFLGLVFGRRRQAS